MLGRAAFAEQIGDVALADGAKLYPGLERERLARAEPHVDAAAALLVRDHHPALMPAEGHGPVLRLEARIPRRPRPRFHLAGFPLPHSQQGFAFERPLKRRLSSIAAHSSGENER